MRDTRGIVLKWDGTPSKLFFDNQARTAELIGTVITGVAQHGEPMELAPYVHRTVNRTAEGILGGIGWQHIKDEFLERLTADGSWAFLYIVVDSAAVNFKMLRSIIADTLKFKRLLVLFSPCYAHILSLVVKWSLGRRYQYGSLLRV